MSRSNSMTSHGQCRLAPLMPCILDSAQLYDLCVKILFKMHATLPPDLLSGHRKRFLRQFSILRQFYLGSSNLQYFKTLIQIPLLPEVKILHLNNFVSILFFNCLFYLLFSILQISWFKLNCLLM